MRTVVWLLALLGLLASNLAPAAPGPPRHDQRADSVPHGLQPDTSWHQTARLQVPLSEPRPAAVLDALIAIIEDGGIETARRHPSDTTRRPVPELRTRWPSGAADGLSQATHLVLGYRFATEAGDLQETLRSITVVIDSTADCGRRYNPLLHLDATREPVHERLAATEVTIRAGDSTRTYDAVPEAVRFAELYEETKKRGTRILTVEGEDACGQNLRKRDDGGFWEQIIIAR